MNLNLADILNNTRRSSWVVDQLIQGDLDTLKQARNQLRKEGRDQPWVLEAIFRITRAIHQQERTVRA